MKFHHLVSEIEDDMNTDIYNSDADYLEEDDTLTAAEAGFMQGYMSA